MWLLVFLTVLAIYIIFYHSPIPLLFAYILYPFVFSLGLAIAGLIGRRHMIGRLILTAVTIAFSIFMFILIIFSIKAGIGIIYWAARILLPFFNALLLLGFIIAGGFTLYKNSKVAK